MQENMLIYLHANDLTHPSWVIVNAQGEIVNAAERDSLEGLSSIAENKYVIVVVPGQDVMLTQVVLPKMNRAKRVKAIPFALEDKLIAEIETLHFAMGDEEVGEWPVAVVSHDKMNEWLSLLREFGIEPDQFIPAPLLLPYIKGVWHIMIEEGVAHIRTGFSQGLTCDHNNLAACLDALLKQQGAPLSVIMMHDDNDFVAAHLLLDVPFEEDRLSFMARIKDFVQHIDLNTLNLLQDRYAAKGVKRHDQYQHIKILFYLMIAAGALIFLYPTFSYFILRYRLSDINDQIHQIYVKHVNPINSGLSPKQAIEARLKKLNEASQENRVFNLLGDIGQALNQSPNIKLSRFDFQNDQMTVVLTAATSKDFSNFVNALNSQNLNVTQQNATLEGERVNATILIK